MAKHPYYGVDIVALAVKTKLRTPITQITKVNIGGANNPEWIVVHFVGAAGQAKANGDYFEYQYREASAHLFADPKVTVRVVPDNRVAWHIGDGAYAGRGGSANGYKITGKATNTNSLGIEGCQDTSTGTNVWAWQFHVDTYVQIILQVIDWQKKYGIPDSRVIRHFDASEKSCPGNWMANNWARWYRFKQDLVAVKKALATGTIPETNPTPVTPDDGKPVVTGMYTIKSGDTLGKIAKAHGVTVANLVSWNAIKNPDLIFPETKIHVKNPANTVPVETGIKQNGKLVPTSGKFKFSEVVNVRGNAAASGAILAQYKHNQTVNYHRVVEANGFIWLVYIRAINGKEAYVSAGTRNVAYGQII